MDVFPFDDTLWFPVVSKIVSVGSLSPPKFDEESNSWFCVFVDSGQEIIKTWGEDAPTCILRLHKRLFPGVKLW